MAIGEGESEHPKKTEENLPNHHNLPELMPEEHMDVTSGSESWFI